MDGGSEEMAVAVAVAVAATANTTVTCLLVYHHKDTKTTMNTMVKAVITKTIQQCVNVFLTTTSNFKGMSCLDFIVVYSH